MSPGRLPRLCAELGCALFALPGFKGWNGAGA